MFEKCAGSGFLGKKGGMAGLRGKNENWEPYCGLSSYIFQGC